jgi:hypothetical protein
LKTSHDGGFTFTDTAKISNEKIEKEDTSKDIECLKGNPSTPTTTPGTCEGENIAAGCLNPEGPGITPDTGNEI